MTQPLCSWRDKKPLKDFSLVWIQNQINYITEFNDDECVFTNAINTNIPRDQPFNLFLPNQLFSPITKPLNKLFSQEETRWTLKTNFFGVEEAGESPVLVT